jgi:hypothetical protein
MVTLLPAGGGANGRLGGSSAGVAGGVPVPNGEVGKVAVVGWVPGGKVGVEEGTGVALPDIGVANGVPVTPGPGYCSVAVSPGPGYALVPLAVDVLEARASTVTVAPVVLVTV